MKSIAIPLLKSALPLAAALAFLAAPPAAAQHEHHAHRAEHAEADEAGHTCDASCPHHAEGHACGEACPHHHAAVGEGCACGEGECACGEGCGCPHCAAAAKAGEHAHAAHGDGAHGHAGQGHAGHGHAGHGAGSHGTAADPHAAHEAMMAAPADEAAAEPVADLDIPDVPVLTQDGERVSFYSDLVEGKTVAMNFIFTTCTTICPPMGANFGRLQDELGARLGRDVHLISVSVDPGTDTPERLKAWSEKFGARDGWTLVTGDVGQVEHLLKALQVFTPDVADHAPVALIGNDETGVWTRAYGLAGPKKLAGIVDEVAGTGPEGTR